MAYQDQSNDPRIDDAVKFLRVVNDADHMNRAEALEDIKFAAGDQWPVEIQNSRNLEARPCLTINKLESYIRQVTNQQRQQRPRIKVQAVSSSADEKIAEVIEGITRHIEVNSNADTAYDTAFDYAVRMGWGFWRINTEYTDESSFDQEIKIQTIDNPFSVYYDPNSVAPDGSDAEKCLITTTVSKEVFRKMYPKADDGANFLPRATGDDTADWVTKEDIRIAEFFYTEREKATICRLSDGSTAWKDELPDLNRFSFSDIQIVDERPSYRKVIRWCKLTAMEILEESTWPGKYIPIVPCYGAQLVVEGKRKKYGLVRNAKDPQRMYNFWRTAMTESIALAPKAKWLLAEGQDEGHENEWALANIKSSPVLRYKQTDIEGRPAPTPVRLQPEPPPDGQMAAAAAISSDLSTVLGIFDPSQQLPGNMSGKALQGQQGQVDLSNFHFYDNMTRSIKQTGKIILDLIPKIYDTQRVMRIIGADGVSERITINEMTAIGEVLNDVTVGQYDVVMDIGPGYNSKRQMAVEVMAPIMAQPEIFQAAGDLWFRNMDFPGADIIADRLAAANPLAQIDDNSDIPPQVQMQLVQAQQQIQQLQQQLMLANQNIQYGKDVKQLHETAETQREQMRIQAKMQELEAKNAAAEDQMRMKVNTDAHDTVVKTETQKELEYIKGQFALMLAKIDAAERRAAAAETAERAI